MIGPPCSGKTTLAKTMIEYDRSILRVNRDELRIMIKGKYVVGDKVVEQMINDITRSSIEFASMMNRDVIIDATNCTVRAINDVKRYAPNATFKYVLCDEPLWKLKLRNIIRFYRTKIWIPTKVINSMYTNFQTLKEKINNNEL
jgi:predicted kinase